MLIKKCSLILFIFVVLLNTFLFPHKLHAETDSVSMADGFVIEADRVEGILGLPGIVSGETTSNQNKLMLRLSFIKATIYGLTITKVINTSSGPMTIQFKSTGPVELKNMAVDVTKIEFGGIYLPNNIGEIGMKNVRLVAHKQTAENADLPDLVASLSEQGVTVDTSSDSDENLQKQAELFAKLLEAAKDGKLQLPEELDKILHPDEMKQDSNKEKTGVMKDVNKILHPDKDGKSEGSKKVDSEQSEAKDTESSLIKGSNTPSSNEKDQTSDKEDNKKSGQTNPSMQQSDGSTTEEKSPTTNTSSNGTKTGNDDNSSNTTPTGGGDTNSDSNNKSKHRGILDLLKLLIP
ncbi:hypothetical protein [Bacillus sp. FJAT-49736]|uniref:hypothetical protein n=1 Tax=Bacillus sp. FJAT-49736 TaxID=2833582 RepID=UPI001BCA4C90|nr:hypothetical protein [Bacillus sp. FJAT-49736]MBS4174546.1 hypothetical protein [Bacillus sp. FJAT-49736]